jgi:hypothetical protein
MAHDAVVPANERAGVLPRKEEPDPAGADEELKLPFPEQCRPGGLPGPRGEFVDHVAERNPAGRCGNFVQYEGEPLQVRLQVREDGVREHTAFPRMCPEEGPDRLSAVGELRPVDQVVVVDPDPSLADRSLPVGRESVGSGGEGERDEPDERGSGEMLH